MAEIQDKGLKVLIDPADPGWGSLIGNAVDRGGGRTPMRDHFDAHCGMEIVLPDGEVMRTGMGALPDSKTWQQYRYGFGPYVDGLFSQSSLGVVTKMGFWLFPQPEAYLTGSVTVMKRDDLIPLVAGLAYLMNSGIVLGTTSVANPLAFARRDPALAALYAKPGGASTEELEQYAQEKNLGFWSVELPFTPRESGCGAVGIREREIFHDSRRQVYRRNNKPLPDQARRVATIQFGCRGHSQPLRIRRWIGAQRRAIWFSPIIPMTGEAILEAQKVFTDAYKELGMSMGPMFFLGPSSNYPRCFLVLFGFPIEHDIEKNRKNRENFKKIVQVAAEHGWGEYRTHTAFMETVAQTYSFNNHALLRFHETVKAPWIPTGFWRPASAAFGPNI